MLKKRTVELKISVDEQQTYVRRGDGTIDGAVKEL
jgi:hypothetical protein